MDQVFLLSAKGRGFSFLHLERNKGRVLFYERIRKFIFLLSAKGSENAQGEFSEFPPRNPKTPHTPPKRKASKRGTFAPLSKGAKRKRQQEDKSDMEKEHIKKEVETIDRVCFFCDQGAGRGTAPRVF